MPWARSVGPARLMPTRLTSCGALLRAYSELNTATSTGVAPLPPYSAGQSIPTQPAAASRACHLRPHSIASASSVELRAGSRGSRPATSRTSDGESRLGGAEGQVHMSSALSRSALVFVASDLEVPDPEAAGLIELVAQLGLVV